MNAPKDAVLRLDRLLANLGYGSRKDVQALIRAGEVILDGAPARASDLRIPLAADLCRRMTIRGAPLDPLPGFVVMLHKPIGVTCSHRDEGPLVFSLLPPRWSDREPALSTVGRLDKETSGLLLLTDDGQLLHRIISPRRKIAKRYHVTLARPLDGAEGEKVAAGDLMLEGEDKPLAPAILEPLGPLTAWLTVTEGRYHLVRRMFAALGNHVEALHRDRIGGLDLPADLPPGRYRRLSADDLEKVFDESPTGVRPGAAPARDP